MIYNPQIGMRVRYTRALSQYFDKSGIIEYVISHPDDPVYTVVGVLFDGVSECRDFYCKYLSLIDPDVERKEQEHALDQKRRKAHADRYL